jgi:hypothetical protein
MGISVINLLSFLSDKHLVMPEVTEIAFAKRYSWFYYQLEVRS